MMWKGASQQDSCSINDKMMRRSNTSLEMKVHRKGKAKSKE